MFLPQFLFPRIRHQRVRQGQNLLAITPDTVTPIAASVSSKLDKYATSFVSSVGLLGKNIGDTSSFESLSKNRYRDTATAEEKEALVKRTNDASRTFGESMDAADQSLSGKAPFLTDDW